MTTIEMLEEMAKSGWTVELAKEYNSKWTCYCKSIMGWGDTIDQAVNACYDAWKESEK